MSWAMRFREWTWIVLLILISFRVVGEGLTCGGLSIPVTGCLVLDVGINDLEWN